MSKKVTEKVVESEPKKHSRNGKLGSNVDANHQEDQPAGSTCRGDLGKMNDV